MNERIEKLKTQAFESVWNYDKDPYGPGTHWRPDGFEEMFAKLIVQECLAKIENEAAQYAEPVWAFELVNDIKEHFGVE